MKVIEQSVELIPQKSGIEGIYEMIDRCAGICYGRKELTKDSKAFVEQMIAANHTKTLEFGTVYLAIPIGLSWTDPSSVLFRALISNTIYNKYNVCNNMYYITTNYRFLYENDLLDVLEYMVNEPTEYHYKRACFHIVASRAIIDECRTHTTISGLVESTRWINYTKERVGSELTFVKPYWADSNKDAYRILQQQWKECETTYFTLIGDGCKAQDAREILPLGLKSETYMCGFYDLPDKDKNTRSGWDMFIHRRYSSMAHPDIQWIAKEIKENLKL